MSQPDPTWVDVASMVTGAAAVVAAVSIPLTSYLRRPAVEIQRDSNRHHSHVELTAIVDHGVMRVGSKVPYIRLLVGNRGWRRTASEARVVVDHARLRGGERITLGCPELAWTSHFDEIRPTIFSGWQRPVDFGVLVKEGDTWKVQLALAKGMATGDRRELLAADPNGYVVRLTVGASDSAGRSYDVDLNWNSEASSPEEALQSVAVAVRAV